MLYEGIPIPIFCKGQIIRRDPDRNMYEVQILESKVGDFIGPIMASLSYSPSDQENYHDGNFVKVVVYLQYFPDSDTYDCTPSAQFDNTIIGRFDPEPIMRGKIEHPLTEAEQSSVVLRHEFSGAGMAADKTGILYLTSGGSVNTVMSPYGYGVHQDSHISSAMNFFRIISHNTSYLAREHFGFSLGADEDTQASNTIENYLMCFRRFVQQTGGIDNWVSTCMGAWNPYVGPNNNFSELAKNREVLFSRIVNAGEKRLTIEEGEPGESFINVRIDDVKESEGQVSSIPGASPATMGNAFKMQVSDSGEIDIRAIGDENPESPEHKFHLSIKDGKMSVYFAGPIEMSHGENAVDNNSIVLDPEKGIDITAKNGLRFGGQELATRAFVDWMDKWKMSLCQVTQIGGPAPIHPLAKPEFETGVGSMAEEGGFTTANEGPKADTAMVDNDNYSSVS